MMFERIWSVSEKDNCRSVRTAFAHAKTHAFGLDIPDAGP